MTGFQLSLSAAVSFGLALSYGLCTGCAAGSTTGGLAERFARIREAVHSHADVRKILGKPDDTCVDGWHAWVYVDRESGLWGFVEFDELPSDRVKAKRLLPQGEPCPEPDAGADRGLDPVRKVDSSRSPRALGSRRP